jgi:hypothetical protein
VAKTYFKSELTVEILSKGVEGVAQGKRREHVVFDLSVAKAKVEVDSQNMAPPTFVAQTRKHGEKQILKQVR